MKTLFQRTQEELHKVRNSYSTNFEYLDYLKTFPTNKSRNYEPFKKKYFNMKRYDGRLEQFKDVDAAEYVVAYEKKISRYIIWNLPERKEHPYREVFNEVRYNLSRPRNRYTKLPIIGNAYIYNASPEFGHQDYNKSRLIKIKGNERFINWLFAYVEKKTGERQPRVEVGK